MKGRVKERWGKLTDDDLTAIAGRRDQLEGMIQERYGYAKERARREIEDWFHSIELNLAEQIETLRCGIEGKSKTGTARWSRTLQSRLNRSAPGFKTCLLPSSALLKSSSLMPAQEQQTLSLMPRKRSSGTRSLLSPSHWVWDF